jgi:hypothetical protein
MMKNRRPLATVFCVLFAGLISATAMADQDGKRLFQPEDVHRIKKVGGTAISPDGEWVAYSVKTTNVDKDSTSIRSKCTRRCAA